MRTVALPALLEKAAISPPGLRAWSSKTDLRERRRRSRPRRWERCGGLVGGPAGTYLTQRVQPISTCTVGGRTRSRVQRFGLAPRAFLVAPIVGPFFSDFATAVIPFLR